MNCKNCGKSFMPGETFCSNCGARIESDSFVNNNVIQNNQPSDFSNSNMGNFNQGMVQNTNPSALNNQIQPNNVNVPLENQNLNNIQPTNAYNNQNYNQMNNMYQNVPNMQQPKPKNNKLFKILGIVGGIVVGFIALFVIIFFVVSANSKKLVCKSSEGNITIMYNNSGITGYTASGIIYDLETQKEYAKTIGTDNYISEFNNWFTTNTSGTCTVDGKEVK